MGHYVTQVQKEYLHLKLMELFGVGSQWFRVLGLNDMIVHHQLKLEEHNGI